jgi:hypothetical protein
LLTKQAMAFQTKGLESLTSAKDYLATLAEEALEFDKNDTKKLWSEFEQDMKISWNNAYAE